MNIGAPWFQIHICRLPLGVAVRPGLQRRINSAHAFRLPRLLIAISIGSAAVPVAAATWTVEVGPGLTYSPATVTISEGDTVRFVNRGGLHNVKANDNSFRCAHGCDGDGQGGNGASSSDIWFAMVTFPRAGTIGYYCETHGTPTSGMRGTIIVEAAVPVELMRFEID